MFGVFYAGKRKGIQRYLEAGRMHFIPDSHFWHNRLGNNRTLFIDSRVLGTSAKTSTYICTLKT